MEFNTTKQRYGAARTKTNVGAADYSKGLQLYTVPPTETISLHEFEELAMDRLKGTWLRVRNLILTLDLWNHNQFRNPGTQFK